MNRTRHEQELEAALQLGEERFRAVADFTYDWETWVGPAGEVLWINPAVERITGHGVAECLAMRDYPLELVHPDDRPGLAAVLERARRRESGNHYEFRVLRKDGSLRWGAISWQPIESARGAWLGYRSSVRDIHEQKQMEARLVEAMRQAESANRAKSEFLANVSHELRTPLQSIVGYAQLLAAAALPVPLGGYVETLLAQGQLLSQLVSDLLDFSSLQAGVLPLGAEPYSPHHLVAGVVRALLPSAHAKGLTLTLEASAAPETCRGDALRISQIVANLVSNAIKFTDRGGVRVSVARRPSSGAYGITVDDTGPGLPAGEAVFEPFRQGSGAGLRGGVGLGLAICRQLCERMGGQIESGSSPDGGARLCAVLPEVALGSGAARAAAFGSSAPAVAVSTEFAKQHPLQVLVIDDAASAREFLQAALLALGYSPALASSASEGIALASTEPYELVFVDLQMPGIDGWSAARELRARLGTGAVLVALTANTLASDAARLADAGFDEFARKPLGLRELQGLLTSTHERVRRPAAALEALFDAERWDELRSVSLGPAYTLLDRMCERALEALPGLRARALAARTERNGVELGRALHDLGGLLALLGVRQVACVRRGEQQLADGELPDAAWQEIDTCVREVHRELLALRRAHTAREQAAPPATSR